MSLENVSFHAKYTVEFLPDEQAFLPAFDSIHIADARGMPVGPNLLAFLDNAYLRKGDEMMPIVSMISFLIMQGEAH